MKDARNQSLTGIISLVVGVFIFSIQDAILKAMSGDHAVTLAIVLRSIVGLPILLAMVAYANGLGALRTRNWKLSSSRMAETLSMNRNLAQAGHGQSQTSACRAMTSGRWAR